MPIKPFILVGFVIFLVALPSRASASSYAELVELFEDWRRFEAPPMHEGAPDYRADTFGARQPDFLRLHARLEALDRTEWSIPEIQDGNPGRKSRTEIQGRKSRTPTICRISPTD